MLLASGVVVVLFGAALLAVAQHRHGRVARTTDLRSDPAVGAGAADIGPAVNAEVPAYVAARQQALATVSGTRLAIASLARYATEVEARRAVAPVDVVALIVAAPGGLPSTVRADLANWAKTQRVDAKKEFGDVHTLVCSKTVDDADFRAFYDTEQQRLVALQLADASHAVVFAVVVRAPADDLRALARAPGIRLVDVGGGGRFDPAAAYRALRPEEVAAAGQPTAYRSFTSSQPVPTCGK
jgi:hypothetical protein